jgi:hypothetical protein
MDAGGLTACFLFKQKELLAKKKDEFYADFI